MPPTVGAAGNFHTAVGFEADRVGALLPWTRGGRGVSTGFLVEKLPTSADSQEEPLLVGAS